MNDVYYAACYDHPNGQDIRLFRTEESAMGWRDQIAAEWWDAEFPDEDRPESEIGAQYFELMMLDRWAGAEYFTVHTAILED